jgi:hypothetical protein
MFAGVEEIGKILNKNEYLESLAADLVHPIETQ